MKKLFDNQCLCKDINLVLDKSIEFTKSDLSGNSIEVKEMNGFKSYIYYDNKISRDKDFDNIISIRNKDE
jgi:hypothetical protein|tara:strand:+ start:343 stop:552 length:210 start_codon:yes stop_codon:yes gene_type:complete